MALPVLSSDLQVLMEQLRQKSAAIPSWNDIIKKAKASVPTHRCALDVDEQQQIGKCINLLMDDMKITTVDELFAQLENVSIKTSLKFMPNLNGSSSFITSDCFYIEIFVNEAGKAVRVCITFDHKKTEESEALMNVINLRNWPELEKHLNGLKTSYINARERAVKTQAFAFLQGVEKELSALTEPRHDIENLADHLLTSEYGYFQARQAGIAGRLYFFLHPYDLLDVHNNNVRQAVSPSDLANLKIGTFAELLLSNCDQCQNLVNAFAEQDLNFALDDMLGGGNTLNACATFAFRFPTGFLITMDSLDMLDKLTGFRPVPVHTGTFTDLILRKKNLVSASKGKIASLVKLPGQSHRYWMNTRSGVEAAEITELRFLNTNLIPKMINVLRANALLTSVFSSCIRNVQERTALQQNNTKNEELCCVHIDCNNASVIECVLENSRDGGFVSAKFDLSNFRTLKVLVTSLSGNSLSFPVDEVGKVFAKCWSIPVTIRSLVLKMKDTTKEEIRAFYEVSPPVAGAPQPPCPVQAWNDVSDQSSDDVNPRSTYNKQSFSSYSPVKEALCSSAGKLAPDKDQQQFHCNLLNLTEFSWRAPRSSNRRPSNLLDLFKEIEVWHELIPPRPCQVMKKQFTNQPHVRNSFHVNMAQPPHLPVSAPPGVLCPMSGAKSAKARHMNSTSEALTELDELCQLSSSLTDSAHPVFDDNHGSAHSHVETPTATEAKPVTSFVDSNKSSIQDAIDSVVGSVNSSPRSAGLSSSSSTGSARMMVPLRSVDFSGMMKPAGQSSPGFSGLQSRSSSRSDSMDVFDFDTSGSSFEMNVSMDMRRHHWSQSEGRMPMSAHARSTSTPGRPGDELDANSWAEQRNTLALRGLLSTRGGSVRRRRARKSMGNVADHTMEIMMKSMRKTERMARGSGGQRRPRKARIMSTDSIRNVAISPGSSVSFLPRKLPVKLPPQQQGLAMAGGDERLDKSSYEQPLCSAPPVYGMVECGGSTGTIVGGSGGRTDMTVAGSVATSVQQRLQPRLEADSGDGSERFKDETLRKQMQAVVRAVFSDVKLTSFADTESEVLSSSTPNSSFSGPERTYCSTSGNVSSDYGSFEGSKGGAGALNDSMGSDGGTPMTGTSATFSGGPSSKLHKRKNSLDAVIGKLMDKVGTGAVESYLDQSGEETMMDPSTDLDMYELPPAAKRLKEDDQDGDQGDAPSSSTTSSVRFLSEVVGGEKKELVSLVKTPAEGSSGENTEISERIKLVIKKSSIIKLPTSRASSSSTKQQRAENKANVAGLKRPSPPLTFSSVTPVPMSSPIKGLTDKDPVLLLEKLQTSNKFDVLKQRIQDKKLRKQVGVHGEQPAKQRVRSSSALSKSEKAVGKQQKMEVAEKKASADKTLQKSLATAASSSSATASDLPRVFSGSEGILFSKSLKGFKIPKIEDSSKGQSVAPVASSASSPSVTMTVQSSLAPQNEPGGGGAAKSVTVEAQCGGDDGTKLAPTTLTINLNREQSKSPARKAFLQPTSKVPKSILKHVGTPSLQSQSMSALGIFQTSSDYSGSTGSFRPYARKTLLPDPPAQSKIMNPDQQKPPCMTPHQRPVLLAFNATPPIEQPVMLPIARPAVPVVQPAQTSSPILVSPPEILPSPESNGLVIDDTPKSPSSVPSGIKEGDGSSSRKSQQKVSDSSSQAECAPTASAPVADSNLEGDV